MIGKVSAILFIISLLTIQPITLTYYEPSLIGPQEQILMKFESKNIYILSQKCNKKYSLKYLPLC